mmetsp:Transcript_14312/g.30715  ORF Transcript_14312/g.30715 Transcript_14312/m.30715 type:complete len:87 (+) Transcript_14312:277-537(+)
MLHAETSILEGDCADDVGVGRNCRSSEDSGEEGVEEGGELIRHCAMPPIPVRWLGEDVVVSIHDVGGKKSVFMELMAKLLGADRHP